MRPFLALGAISAGLSVAAGAFGAHALRAHLDARALEIWETAARYQMYHALALILVGVMVTRSRGSAEATAGVRGIAGLVRFAGLAFVAGTILFSGSLYAMALTGMTVLGAITPLGGAAFLAGWGVLAFAAIKARES